MMTTKITSRDKYVTSLCAERGHRSRRVRESLSEERPGPSDLLKAERDGTGDGHTGAYASRSANGDVGRRSRRRR
jgi:hypothetical protein